MNFLACVKMQRTQRSKLPSKLKRERSTQIKLRQRPLTCKRLPLRRSRICPRLKAYCSTMTNEANMTRVSHTCADRLRLLRIRRRSLRHNPVILPGHRHRLRLPHPPPVKLGRCVLTHSRFGNQLIRNSELQLSRQAGLAACFY